MSGREAQDNGAPNFRVLFETAPGLYLVVRADDAPHFTIVAVSDAYLAATLTTRDGPGGIVGRALFEVFPDPPGDPDATGVANLRASLERALATGAPDPMPVQAYAIRRPDGAWEARHWRPLNTPVVDPATGRITHLIHRVEDVTAAVRLAAEHDRLRGAHAASERARRGAEDANVLLASERTGLADANRQLQGEAVALERQAEALRATTAELGERTTAAETALAALAESEARYRALFDAVDEGFAVFELLDDADGRAVDFRILEANSAFERHTGLQHVVGRTARELVADRARGWIETYDQVARTGAPTRFEGGSDPLGHRLDVFAYRVGRPDERRVAALFRDVTAARAAERERERLLRDSEAARAEAEAANRVKGEFLAVMSHELRTPLNAIGGYAELMEMGIRGPVTDAQRQDLGRIQRSQRHLLGLVNEVLNYAKLETGSVRYDLAAVVVGAAIAEAEGLVSPQARARGLTLTAAGCADDLAVRADAEKLRQVLVNLLSNAVKFTDRGGDVAVDCVAEGERVAIRVRDTGIGIAADQLDRIFEPFVQVRSDLRRTAEGTGLGLAISRDLARGMGGDLTIESTPGVGSMFTLMLPRG